MGTMQANSSVQEIATGQRAPAGLRIGLLTAGRDKPYALGLGPALADEGLAVDFIGSDVVDGPAVRNHPNIRFRNLRNQAEQASPLAKIRRVLAYYARLLAYAASSKAPVFHILWNNKFEVFDRTLLMIYYRLLGKRLVLHSDTYRDRHRLRAEIRAFTNERYSWSSVARTTHDVYSSLVHGH